MEIQTRAIQSDTGYRALVIGHTFNDQGVRIQSRVLAMQDGHNTESGARSWAKRRANEFNRR